MATVAERMDTVEDRLDRIERLTEFHGAFVTRFEEKVDRYIEEMKADREQAARQREEDRQEAARRQEEFERQREEDRQEAARRQEGFERQREEDRQKEECRQEKFERYREEADRERREMNKRWGELANRMGVLVEDLVAPSVRRMARELFGCGDERSFVCRIIRVLSDDPSRCREFDALYVGTRGVVLNETKSSPDSTDVRAFVSFLESGEFALYFPEHRHLPVVPVFSSLNLPDDMVTKLTRNGIYALAMGDEAMQVLNLDAVRRRTAAAGRPSR